MAYKKSDWAESLGISTKELENRASKAGFGTTEEFYRATGGTGQSQQDFYANQAKQEKKFMDRFSGFVGGLPSYSDIASRLSEEMGLPQAREHTRGLINTGLGLEQQIADLPEQIEGESRGFDVNATQRARIEQQRGGEITQNLTDVSREASRASAYQTELENLVAQGLSYEQAQRELQMQPWLMEAGMLSDRLAREATGFTTQMQNNLSMMLAQMQEGGAMDRLQVQQLGELALAEKDFIRQKEMVDYQYQLKKKYGGGTTDYYPTLNDGWNTGGGSSWGNLDNLMTPDPDAYLS